MASQNILEKIKLPNLIIAIVILVVGFNLYNRQVAETGALQKRIVKEEEKNKVLESISDLKSKLEEYFKALPPQEFQDFMAMVQRFGKESGVTVSSVKPLAEKLQEDYKILPFSVTVSAPSYNALAKFINKIESSDKVSFVDSGNITSAGPGQIKVDLAISCIMAESKKNEE